MSIMHWEWSYWSFLVTRRNTQAGVWAVHPGYFWHRKMLGSRRYTFEAFFRPLVKLWNFQTCWLLHLLQSHSDSLQHWHVSRQIKDRGAKRNIPVPVLIILEHRKNWNGSILFWPRDAQSTPSCIWRANERVKTNQRHQIGADSWMQRH